MADAKSDTSEDQAPAAKPTAKKEVDPAPRPAKEIGGRGGLDPTRYGDWEKGGRAIDF